MAFIRAGIVGSTVHRNGQNQIIRIDVQCEIENDAWTPPVWRGQIAFEGGVLAGLLSLGAVARRAAIRTAARDYMKQAYPVLQRENAPAPAPEVNDVSQITPFTESELT